MDVSFQVKIRGPKNPLNPVWRNLSSSAIISGFIFPLANSTPEGDKHLQYFVPKYLLQGFRINRRGNKKQVLSVEASIRFQDMKMKMKS
jgi:hypothetical protein